MRPLAVLPLIAGALLLPTAAHAGVVYFNDFESGIIGPEWGPTAYLTNAPTFTRFMGRFSNNSAPIGDHVTLTLPNGGDDNHGGGAGQGLLSFDLYIIDSWEGDWGGPDRMQVVVNGSMLFNYTFSNTNPPQSYPLAPTVGPAQLGFHSTIYDRDSIYRNVQIPFDPGSGNQIVITWQGAGLENVPDESWGIDNVHVTTTSAPAPGPAALLGLGALIAGKRRRRARS